MTIELMPRGARIDKLDEMTWSYSRVNSYRKCPYEFYLKYLEKRKPARSNSFAQAGKLMHSILERYYSGELDLYALSSTYDEEFEECVTEPFPIYMPDMKSKIRDEGYAYLNDLEGISPGCEAWGVETHIKGKIGGYKFHGYIDLIMRCRSTKRTIFVDHKSKKAYKTKAERECMFDQLYLYSRLYGRKVDELRINMFRARKIETELYNEANADAACARIVKGIEDIYDDDSFTPCNIQRKENMYCQYMCAMRDHCPYSMGRNIDK